MALSFFGKGIQSINNFTSKEYKQSIIDYQKKSKGLRLGYCPGNLLHFFHGSKKNRKYTECWQILVKYQYNPYLHVTKNEDGLIIPSNDCSQGLLDEILQYFKEHNEDEFFT